MKLLKIASRLYRCPMCGNLENHSTNHEGEIYCNCKACGNMPLYFAGRDIHADMKFKEVVMHCYSFGSCVPQQQDPNLADYADLELLMKLRGYKKFAVATEYRQWTAIREHDGKTVKLYLPFQWADQFVTNIGRLHQWWEAVFPNKEIHNGYYLEM